MKTVKENKSYFFFFFLSVKFFKTLEKAVFKIKNEEKKLNQVCKRDSCS